MTDQECHDIYAQGEAAVVAALQSLASALIAAHGEMSVAVAALTQRVQELEARLSKDSHNSGKPPSSDGLRKKPAPKSLRPMTGKPSGGQPGHPGVTLCLSDSPDETLSHAPTVCSECHASLEGVPTQDCARRQVHDLPPLKLHVTEHRAFSAVCPRCQTLNRAPFPAPVSQPVQYGARLKALCVYLQQYQLLPYARTSELLSDLLGASLCQATLANTLSACHESLAQTEAAIKTAVGSAPVAHFDETGIRIDGKLHWLHTASTKTLTFLAAHEKRGREAADLIGILPTFSGTAVHDAFATYFGYGCSHALCNAHLLRELIFLQEQTGQPWIPELISLLLDGKRHVEQARSRGETRLPVACRDALVARYHALIGEGRAANPPTPPSGKRGRTKQTDAYNLLERLGRHPQAVLAFLHGFAVPFDNNQAERDLRMSKVRQKISGCFRSREGADIFCRVRGYIATLRKQGIHVLTALQSVFEGSPIMPKCTAE